MLRLLHPQNLAYHNQHHRYVARYAHKLIRTHHGDVYCNYGQLRHLALYYLLHPYYRRSVHLLLDTLMDGSPFVCYGSIFFGFILVVDGLVGVLVGDGARLVCVFEL